jgi:hypothetical protein
MLSESDFITRVLRLKSANLRRKHCFSLFALAGDEAPQAAEGIYQAIQDVCGWWP